MKPARENTRINQYFGYMKSALLVLLIFGLARSVASGQVLRIDSMPVKGMTFDQGWRWHAGDNVVWASASLDDSRWDTVVSDPIIDQLPAFRKTGIGWLRLQFQLDSSVAAQPMSIRVAQIGASQIFLDGKFLRTYGILGTSGQAIEAATSPQGDYELLPPLSRGIHTFAVRLAHRPVPWYEPSRLDKVNSVFALRIAPTTGLVRRSVLHTFWDAIGAYWLAGFFLALAVVHAFYFVYRRKRISLIFSATMLFGVIYFVSNNAFSYIGAIEQLTWIRSVSILAFTLYFCCLLLTYYVYLQRRPGLVFWLTAALMLVNVMLSNYSDFEYTSYLFSFGMAMLLTQGMFLSVRATKAKSADGRIVMGSLISLIVMLTSQLVVSTFFHQAVETFDQVTNMLFFVTVPLTLALLLARENARTNAQLTLNLAEVKQLSEEKEIILTQQKAFLEQQVAARTAELSQSLADLRSTQQQLIQREKMASLGELTAGIAHEIQNPLNFVTNFTEVSTELVDEIQEEKKKPAAERDEALETELLGDLTQNLEKISFHGKRASNIVRGMLEHSRTSAGQREPTDINALADEYLRLSYHGLRGKDKVGSTLRFNASLLTDFDSTLPPVSVVSQDIGRVLLNLFNNAFYAVHQRATRSPATYAPTVSVSTRAVAGGIEIRVSDNGTGIPAEVRDKIFHPFFTTKPSGEGTGLGLSLSYDIITKGHNGTFTVKSVEGEGSTFVITLNSANE